MPSRQNSVNKFLIAVDNLCNSKYIMANSKVFDVITVINQSKLLSDMINYFVKDFDYYNCFVNALNENDGVKFFKLPPKSTEVIAFVFLLLNEVNYKRIQLSDLLDYFDAGKNYEQAYVKFCQEVLQPFKSYVYSAAMQIINVTSGTSEGVVAVENVETSTEQSVATKKVSISATILRLIELDSLAVRSSRISKDEKEDLLFVLETFSEIIRGKDSEKIKLCFLAYYHAFKPYRKIKNNLAGISEILREEGII